MFNRIKKAFSRPAKEEGEAVTPSQLAHGPMSEWAGTQGFALSLHGDGQTVALEGKVGGRQWRMEAGRPTRNYIRGEELRARADLRLAHEPSLMVINRPLKSALERRAYATLTDTLRTTSTPDLPEEMRWLAMYEEMAWDSLPEPFWERYAVIGDSREDAAAWVDTALAAALTGWPAPVPSAEVPFLLLLARGKAYLRMEHAPPDMGTLQHALQVFTTSCESALAAFSSRA
ncbi:MAG: hypothetical protein V4864_03650 [Pseudomonadota bacterium]